MLHEHMFSQRGRVMYEIVHVKWGFSILQQAEDEESFPRFVSLAL